MTLDRGTISHIFLVLGILLDFKVLKGRCARWENGIGSGFVKIFSPAKYFSKNISWFVLLSVWAKIKSFWASSRSLTWTYINFTKGLSAWKENQVHEWEMMVSLEGNRGYCGNGAWNWFQPLKTALLGQLCSAAAELLIATTVETDLVQNCICTGTFGRTHSIAWCSRLFVAEELHHILEEERTQRGHFVYIFWRLISGQGASA